MKKGKIGLAVGLLAITSFAGLKAPAVKVVNTEAARPIDKSVIEEYANKSKSNIVYKINDKKIVKAEEFKEIKSNELHEVSDNITLAAAKTETMVKKPETVAVNNPIETIDVVEPKADEVVHLSTAEPDEEKTVVSNEEKSSELDLAEKTESLENNETQEFSEVKPGDETEAETDVAKEETVSLSVKGFIKEDVEVKSGRGDSAQVIGVLDKGHEVIGEAQNGWVKVSFNGMIGYISESLLSTTEAVLTDEEEPKTDENKEVKDTEDPKVEEPEVPVETPVVEEPVVEEPVVEEPVVEEPVAEEPKVEDPVAEDPKVEEPVTEEPVRDNEVSGDAITNIVNAARSLVGSSYVWAGSSPDVGFDCSGLTSYLYREYAGVELSRITTGQAGNGYAVSKENIQPGDIILFQNDWSDHVDHVGIYVGGGSYVHAATEERGVVIDSAEGSYFQNNVVGVRRILN
ncbi:C40 family peptidase [Microaceticoccus formicicus]|uniref:C40 family peptidase n=1 Tax=Microaceticoccus formicicus TaxID=3118105 RepID=UPI003CD0027B|nr:C40 family peptidase [Peptoniphilaceae bacterium AMB_02]